jgi:hypothetical protein
MHELDMDQSKVNVDGGYVPRSPLAARAKLSIQLSTNRGPGQKYGMVTASRRRWPGRSRHL